ncbi:hypothetical protein [Pseudothermotoga thermarum]|uniref:hypothetical protein n=1 Tax=Pseudothermotoga thermarum TaxID=119394 RepID=UPI00145D0649|nr:hypothetical protein [Pseudothermotoga thermarum]
MKIDEQGNTVWEKNYNEPIQPSSMIKTAFDSYILVGAYVEEEYNRRLALVELNSNGEIKQIEVYELEADSFFVIKQTVDGNYVLAGGNKVIKVNSNSWEIVWIKYYNCWFSFFDIESLSNGEFVVVGDNLILKLDSQGNQIKDVILQRDSAQLYLSSFVLEGNETIIVAGIVTLKYECKVYIAKIKI